LTAFNRVAATFSSFSDPPDVGCSSTLWTDIIFAMPALKAPMKEILALINLHRAREDNKAELWTDPERFPGMENAQFAIMAVESELAEQLKKSECLSLSCVVSQTHL
jgi:DNA mismatch repair protein MSH3